MVGSRETNNSPSLAILCWPLSPNSSNNMLRLQRYTVTNILYTCLDTVVVISHALKCRLRPPLVENHRSQLGHFRAVDMTHSSFDIILKMGWCPVEYVIAVLACHIVISNYIKKLKLTG